MRLDVFGSGRLSVQNLSHEWAQIHTENSYTDCHTETLSKLLCRPRWMWGRAPCP